MAKLDLKKATKVAYPPKIQPMLSTLVETAPQGAGWIYEIKFDGYRALSFCKKTDVELVSRNNKSFNEKFYPIVDALKALKLEAVLDGEIVVVNEKGTASFEGLQNWR